MIFTVLSTPSVARSTHGMLRKSPSSGPSPSSTMTFVGRSIVTSPDAIRRNVAST